MAPFFINRHLFDLSPLRCDVCLASSDMMLQVKERCVIGLFWRGGVSKNGVLDLGLRVGGNSVVVPAGDVGRAG